MSQLGNQYTTIREIIDAFSDLTKASTIAFGGTQFKGGVSNFAWL